MAQGSPTPKVSVIIPVYNVEPYIARCVESLRGQTMRDLEFIFVDDCSTDGSMEAVRTWAAEDPRVRILENERNLGSGPSRNRGIEEACGEYLNFVDADDWVSPDFYRLLYAAATADGGHDIAKGVRRKVYGGDGAAPADLRLNHRIRAHLADGRPLYGAFTYEHQTALYRRSLFGDGTARYGTSRNAQDTTFLLRCCWQTDDIVFEEAACYYYVQREGSVVHSGGLARTLGEIDALSEKIDFLQERGFDGRSRKLALTYARTCLRRFQQLLGEGSARLRDYPAVALALARQLWRIVGPWQS